MYVCVCVCLGGGGGGGGGGLKLPPLLDTTLVGESPTTLDRTLAPPYSILD